MFTDAVKAAMLTIIASALAYVLIEVKNIEENQLKASKYINLIELLVEDARDTEQRLRLVERCNKPCD